MQYVLNKWDQWKLFSDWVKLNACCAKEQESDKRELENLLQCTFPTMLKGDQETIQYVIQDLPHHRLKQLYTIVKKSECRSCSLRSQIQKHLSCKLQDSL